MFHEVSPLNRLVYNAHVCSRLRRMRILTVALMLAAAARIQAAGRCEDLAKLVLADVAITKAESVAAGTSAPARSGALTVPLPAACVVHGMIAQRTGVDGKRYGIGF